MLGVKRRHDRVIPRAKSHESSQVRIRYRVRLDSSDFSRVFSLHPSYKDFILFCVALENITVVVSVESQNQCLVIWSSLLGRTVPRSHVVPFRVSRRSSTFHNTYTGLGEEVNADFNMNPGEYRERAQHVRS